MALRTIENNQIVVSKNNNYFLPTSFEQAERFAEKIASSALCPNAFRGKSADVFIAMQMGAEVGLSPMQAIQNIAVINGRPSLWGDALLALVKSHRACVSVREWMEGSIKDGDLTAYCGVTRKGQQEEVRSFSMEQAKKAALWGKAGPWTQYPERMLQMRARGFAARDVFPDALKGLHSAEEVQDIIEVTPVENKKVERKPLSQSFTVEQEVVDECLLNISQTTEWEELKHVYYKAREAVKGDKDAINKITAAVKEKQTTLKNPKDEVKEQTEGDNNETL